MRVPITEAKRQQILSLRHMRTQAEIARFCGVSGSLVSKILSGQYTRIGWTAPPEISQPSTISHEELPMVPEVTVFSHTDPLPEVPEDVPATTDLALVDKWISKVERAANNANAVGNVTAFASLAAKLVALLEHRRKVMPIPKEDPNEHPDMIALGDQVWTRLKKILDMEV